MTRLRLAMFASGVLATSTAEAGGMVLPVRGVRTLERGGALVAGAEDADALWLNPAGLAHLAGSTPKQRMLLFDAAFVYQNVEHTRLDGDGAALLPVTNQQPGQPVPTLAGALAVTDRLVIAGGITSPYSGFGRYAPDGPQRYAQVSLDGSRIVLVTAGIAYKVSDTLRVGATVQNVVTQLSSTLVVSGCPGAQTCGRDDASFDMQLAIEQDDFVSPTASAGVQYDAMPSLTLGLVLQGPAKVTGKGSLATTLPSALEFDAAEVIGDRATLAFWLPPAIKAGVEWRPDPHWRIEAALDVELWSLHDEVEIEPINVSIANITGANGGTFSLAPMTIARDYKTSYAPALGVEWHGPRVMFGAGYGYETAAAPTGTVSVLTVDAAKHLVGLGGGYELEGWQIGAAAGFVAVDRVDVSVADARVTKLAPISSNPDATPINAGSYKSRYVIAGLRFARRW
ncbi:MAG: outer membrane protein transport protein [Kofleriaceae bacterium]